MLQQCASSFLKEKVMQSARNLWLEMPCSPLSRCAHTSSKKTTTGLAWKQQRNALVRLSDRGVCCITIFKNAWGSFTGFAPSNRGSADWWLTSWSCILDTETFFSHFYCFSIFSPFLSMYACVNIITVYISVSDQINQYIMNCTCPWIICNHLIPFKGEPSEISVIKTI